MSLEILLVVTAAVLNVGLVYYVMKKINRIKVEITSGEQINYCG